MDLDLNRAIADKVEALAAALPARLDAIAFANGRRRSGLRVVQDKDVLAKVIIKIADDRIDDRVDLREPAVNPRPARRVHVVDGLGEALFIGADQIQILVVVYIEQQAIVNPIADQANVLALVGEGVAEVGVDLRDARVLSDDGIQPPVMVVVVPDRQTATHFRERDVVLLRLLAQGSVEVDQELVLVVDTGGDQEVLIAVIVEVGEGTPVRISALPIAEGVDRAADIGEGAVAVVAVQTGPIAVIADEQINKSVVVDISPGRAVRLRQRRGATGRPGIGKADLTGRESGSQRHRQESQQYARPPSRAPDSVLPRVTVTEALPHTNHVHAPNPPEGL